MIMFSAMTSSSTKRDQSLARVETRSSWGHGITSEIVARRSNFYFLLVTSCFVGRVRYIPPYSGDRSALCDIGRHAVLRAGHDKPTLAADNRGWRELRSRPSPLLLSFLLVRTRQGTETKKVS